MTATRGSASVAFVGLDAVAGDEDVTDRWRIIIFSVFRLIFCELIRPFPLFASSTTGYGVCTTKALTTLNHAQDMHECPALFPHHVMSGHVFRLHQHRDSSMRVMALVG